MRLKQENEELLTGWAFQKNPDGKWRLLSSRFSVGLSEPDKVPPVVVLFLPLMQTECFFSLQFCLVGSAVVNLSSDTEP